VDLRVRLAQTRGRRLAMLAPRLDRLLPMLRRDLRRRPLLPVHRARPRVLPPPLRPQTGAPTSRLFPAVLLSLCSRRLSLQFSKKSSQGLEHCSAALVPISVGYGISNNNVRLANITMSWLLFLQEKLHSCSQPDAKHNPSKRLPSRIPPRSKTQHQYSIMFRNAAAVYSGSMSNRAAAE
jgi:hypothetical protein